MEQLEAKFGSKWRSVPNSSCMRTKWSTRNFFYRSIKALIAEGKEESAAVAILQAQLDSFPKIKGKPGWKKMEAVLKAREKQAPQAQANTAGRNKEGEGPNPISTQLGLDTVTLPRNRNYRPELQSGACHLGSAQQGRVPFKMPSTLHAVAACLTSLQHGEHW